MVVDLQSKKIFLGFIFGALLVGLLGGLVAWYSRYGPGSPFQPLLSPSSSPTVACTPHYYENPNISLQNVVLRLFYFVPKDRTGTWLSSDIQAWGVPQGFQRVLEEVREFHKREFGGRSTFNYRICEKPIAGNFSASAYENSEILQKISQEVRQELYEEQEDIFFIKKIFTEIENYLPFCGDAFSQTPKNSYIVSAVLYGISEQAHGGVLVLGEADEKINVLLIPTWVQYSRLYGPKTATVFYHELSHLFGIPEGYDLVTLEDITTDIMAPKHFTPIRETYLDQRWKDKMGLPATCLSGRNLQSRISNL